MAKKAKTRTVSRDIPASVEWTASVVRDLPTPVEHVFRPEFVEALILLAKACDDLEKADYPRPILVGGAAVELHTGSALVSGDFDFVTTEQRAFEDALISYGFRREDRDGRLLIGLYHPALSLGVQVVSGQLFDGRAEWSRVELVEIVDGKAIRVAPIEDMIADRLGQFVATRPGPVDMRDQAIKLFQLADRLDTNYLDKRIREETCGELGAADLAQMAK